MNSISDKPAQPKSAGTKQQFYVIRLVWIMLFASQWIYFFLLFQKFGEPTLNLFNMLDDTFVLAISIAAIITLFLSQLVYKIFLKYSIKSLAVTRENIKEKLGQVFLLPFVFRIAIIETVVIYGYVISEMQKENLLIPFLSLSLFAFLYVFPSVAKATVEVNKIMTGY